MSDFNKSDDGFLQVGCRMAAMRITYLFISHKKMSIVFGKGRSTNYKMLENQPGKQISNSKDSRDITTEPIAVWVQTMFKTAVIM